MFETSVLLDYWFWNCPTPFSIRHFLTYTIEEQCFFGLKLCMWPSRFTALGFFKIHMGVQNGGIQKAIDVAFYPWNFISFYVMVNIVICHLKPCHCNNSATFLNYRHLNFICMTCYRMLEVCDCSMCLLQPSSVARSSGSLSSYWSSSGNGSSLLSLSSSRLAGMPSKLSYHNYLHSQLM